MNDGRIAVVISWPVSEKKLAPATPTTPVAEPGFVGVDVRVIRRLGCDVAARRIGLLARHFIPPACSRELRMVVQSCAGDGARRRPLDPGSARAELMAPDHHVRGG